MFGLGRQCGTQRTSGQVQEMQQRGDEVGGTQTRWVGNGGEELF